MYQINDIWLTLRIKKNPVRIILVDIQLTYGKASIKPLTVCIPVQQCCYSVGQSYAKGCMNILVHAKRGRKRAIFHFFLTKGQPVRLSVISLSSISYF